MQWVSLGDYIEQCDERNSKGKYGEADVKGIATSKQLIETKANLEGVSLSSYKIVNPNEFTFVPDTSRRGDKMSLAFNNLGKACIVSSISCVFRIKDPLVLLPDYLYLWFCRPEFDRYARFNSWGSAREAFSYEDMERVQIPLPDIDEQRKIVSVWKGLRDLKVQNEVIAEPLFELCQSYLKQLKEEYEPTEIGPYIEEVNEKNTSKIYSEDNVRGISIQKEFIATKANLDGVSLSSYKVVEQNNFSFNPNTARMGEKICVSLNTSDMPYLVSAIYPVFKIIDTNKLLPEYLMLWYKRSEFDRYSRFNSWGSAREVFNYSDMCRVQIPIPSPEKQRAIVNIYNCAKEAKDIANKTDQLIKDICPALMRQVIGEAS